MARILPDGWQEIAPTGAALREIETLRELEAGLSDRYTVYHGVHWSRVTQGTALYGEIDFVLVNPAGQLLIIEQKSGLLHETGQGLVKRYAQVEKNVPVQLARNRDGLLGRLIGAVGAERVKVEALLYCPDYTVRSPATAGVDPARIVDAGRRAHLCHVIRTLLPEDGEDAALADKVHRFLRDLFELVPDVGAMTGEASVLYTRLSSGLAHWAQQIEADPFRLRVVGTAGSGKTQLALEVLREAAAAGRHARYVCYNRPLADHIARLAPHEVEVATYHQLADRCMRAAGQPPDFKTPGAFQAMEVFLDRHCPDPAEQVDELIIDEGQDFQPAWLDNLLRGLGPGGRAWWLEDPMQNLYRRASPSFSGWITLNARTNYRSPKDIVGHINRLLDPGEAVQPGSPFCGSEVDILTYATPMELMDRTKTAITRGLGAGFRKPMLALVTYRGREHSLFTPLDRLGPHVLQAFTGQYDLFGNPVRSEGDLFIDSVYRFKGQSAPCVILTEIDFETLDEVALKKLFVGMTRATMKLVLVMTERAARAMMARL